MLKKTQMGAIAGWEYRKFLVEVRFTQALQSIFKDREGLVEGFVKVGGHEPTLRRPVDQFGPFLESATNRDVAVMTAVRF